ncbi:MAG: hypothetical protein ACMUJM_25005 [bacterium]
MTTTIHISGLNSAAYILAPSSAALPLLDLFVDFTTALSTTLWAGEIFPNLKSESPTGYNYLIS